MRRSVVLCDEQSASLSEQIVLGPSEIGEAGDGNVDAGLDGPSDSSLDLIPERASDRVELRKKRGNVRLVSTHAVVPGLRLPEEVGHPVSDHAALRVLMKVRLETHTPSSTERAIMPPMMVANDGVQSRRAS